MINEILMDGVQCPFPWLVNWWPRATSESPPLLCPSISQLCIFTLAFLHSIKSQGKNFHQTENYMDSFQMIKKNGGGGETSIPAAAVPLLL